MKHFSICRPLLKFSRNWIEIGYGTPNESSAQDVTIESTVPLDALEARCAESVISAKLSQQSKTQYILSLGLLSQPTESSHPFSSDVSFIAQLKSGQRVAIKGIAVSGRTFSSVFASPESINFGLLDSGTTATMHIAIRSTTDDSFHIVSTTCDCKDATVDVAEPGLGPRIINLHLNARELGRREFSINVLGRKDDGKPFDIQIPVRYLGTGLQSKIAEDKHG